MLLRVPLPLLPIAPLPLLAPICSGVFLMRYSLNCLFTSVVRFGGSDSPKSMGNVAAAAAAVVAVDEAEEMTERELMVG